MAGQTRTTAPSGPEADRRVAKLPSRACSLNPYRDALLSASDIASCNTFSAADVQVALADRVGSLGRLGELRWSVGTVAPIAALLADQLGGESSQTSLDTGPNGLKQRAAGRQQEGAQDYDRPAKHTAMSETLQSIQSLSMQLNRASSLMGQSELSSSVSLAGPQSPALAASGAAQAGLAQSSSSKISRLVGKKAARVKELLLQNIGKANRTTDELFQMYEENFYKQQAQALKLQKEFKLYVAALKGAHEASKSLNGCIQTATGEYQSARHDLVCENLSQMEHLSEDLMEKLRGQILANMSEYLCQFGELRDKIAKRKRKLIDFDSSRRVYELTLAAVNKRRLQMQQIHSQPPQNSSRGFRGAFMLSQSRTSDSFRSATSQLVEEARLLKLREQYNYCKIMYETINGELHEELPLVYEKKMKHLLLTLQSYFALEAQFHSNAGKLFASASDVIDELPMSKRSLAGQHTHLAEPAADTGNEYGSKAVASGSSGMGSSGGDSSLESSSSSPEAGSNTGSPTNEDHEGASEHGFGAQPEHPPGKGSGAAEGAVSLDCSPADERQEPGLMAAAQPEAEREAEGGPLSSGQPGAGAAVSEALPSAADKPGQLERDTAEGHAPPLYKVKTNYKYLAEDVDELCFEADEIIQVVSFEEPHEQEDGWLMGVREVNGQRGLFPANFTEPI